MKRIKPKLGTKNTRELLLKSATNLFYKKSYSTTSIREIGAKTGISSSIIYHYFKNKEEMLFEIARYATEGLIQSLHETERNISDPVECLREMLKLQTLKRNKEGKILLLESYQLGGKRFDIIRKMQYEIYEIYKKKVKEIEDKGLLREDIDLTILTFSIFGIINSIHGWYKGSGRLSKEEVVDNIERFLLNGILKEN